MQNGSGRLIALDVARACAVFGMIVVNVGPYTDEGPTSWLVRAFNGRASVLFVILAGIGVTLLTRRRRLEGIRIWPVLLWRSALLLVLGLGLQLLGHGVNVILASYAALFCLAIAVVRLPSRWLLGLAITTVGAGPLLWLLLHQVLELPTHAAEFGDGPVTILSSLLISGPYPLIVWASPFLLGVWLGRLALGERRVARRLLLLGAGFGAGAWLVAEILTALWGEPVAGEYGWDLLITAFGHSQMPLWLISSSGTSVMLIGALLLVLPGLQRLTGWSREAAETLTAALAASGQLALSVYVAHLLALAVMPELSTAAAGTGVSFSLMLVLVGSSFLWRHRFRQGPLERLMRLPQTTSGSRNPVVEPPQFTEPQEHTGSRG